MGTINIDSLADEVSKALEEYTQETASALKEETKRAAERCAEKVRQNSKVFGGSGRYAKGWAAKKTYESKDDVRYTVHNKTDYQLTHLLEYGHAKVLWGKKTGDKVTGRAHIRPAEEDTIREFENNVKVRLG